jgi:DDE superfamily endonuclease
MGTATVIMNFVTTIKDQVAVEAAIAEQAWADVFGTAMNVISGCFARPEAREMARQLTGGLLLELETRYCWTLAAALGHPEPHRLQHLLSRARFDHDQARKEIARLTIDRLTTERGDAGVDGDEVPAEIDDERRGETVAVQKLLERLADRRHLLVVESAHRVGGRTAGG